MIIRQIQKDKNVVGKAYTKYAFSPPGLLLIDHRDYIVLIIQVSLNFSGYVLFSKYYEQPFGFECLCLILNDYYKLISIIENCFLKTNNFNLARLVTRESISRIRSFLYQRVECILYSNIREIIIRQKHWCNF